MLFKGQPRFDLYSNTSYQQTTGCSKPTIKRLRKVVKKVIIKTPQRSHYSRAGAFIVNFEHILLLLGVLLLLTLTK